MPAPGVAATQDMASAGPSALFGLDAGESAAFAEAFVALARPLGLDGRQIVDALTRGETLGQALNLPHGVADLLYGRAHGLFGAGRADRAEPLFRALCVIDAPTADHWIGYGLCLRERHADGEAEIAFATAAALRPAWAIPQFHAAQLALARERWSVAAEHLAAFHRNTGPDVPPAMLREAQRQSRALALRAGPRQDASP